MRRPIVLASLLALLVPLTLTTPVDAQSTGPAAAAPTRTALVAGARRAAVGLPRPTAVPDTLLAHQRPERMLFGVVLGAAAGALLAGGAAHLACEPQTEGPGCGLTAYYMGLLGAASGAVIGGYIATRPPAAPANHTDGSRLGHLTWR